MHIAQYWSEVYGISDHDDLTILALAASFDDEISEEQSIELGDHIRKRREQLEQQGIKF